MAYPNDLKCGMEVKKNLTTCFEKLAFFDWMIFPGLFNKNNLCRVN